MSNKEEKVMIDFSAWVFINHPSQSIRVTALIADYLDQLETN